MTLQMQIKRILVDALHLEDFPPDTIDDGEPLFGDRLGLDSIDALEIVHQVEKNFGIHMKDRIEARAAMESVNTLTAFIEDRRQG